MHYRALCYSPTARLDSCKFFRNYRSPQQITQDVTVVEAIQATWATPNMIPTISIGPEGRDEMVTSGINWFGNPIREVIKEAYHVFAAEAKASCILSLGSGFSGIASIEEAVVVTRLACMDGERVAREVNSELKRLNVYYRLSVDYGLEGSGPFVAGFGVIKSHADAYLNRDEPGGRLDQCVDASAAEATVTLERICEFTGYRGNLLISSRWASGTGKSIDTRTSTSFRLLRRAQETNGGNHQRTN
jgi:hypothetical protein